MQPNQTMTSLCLDKIQQLILSGELLPGDKIKGEYLKNLLGVGLSPIREALSRLANTPLVEFVDNIGFTVACLSKEKIVDTYTTYAKIEMLSLADAIEFGDDLWESKIIASLYRLSKVEKDQKSIRYRDWVKLNNEFHESLIEGCKLEYLKKIRNECVLIRDWYFTLAFPDLDERLIEVSHSEHQRLAELAIAREKNLASELIYSHTLHSLEILIARISSRNLFN
ncbi:GntR family transcriptional regulator [Aquella oligotrophica]|uniref:HTH gntR-type domain-containing protein n=1 Tax=Aquella oligotrophica TaxID=2067065 RepID=A0A2I7N7L5_9NEIS|nr:GntR family transcriptional regulator [Aquella oligotrophica]AUR52422.1 hypothetical protein CUN60_08970 [Aquella oligotrophica]